MGRVGALVGRSLTGNVLVERDGLRMITPQGEDAERRDAGTHVWALKFENSPGIEEIVPQHWAITKHNFFRAGHSASNVPAARELLLKSVYPGIDLRLYSQEQSRLEFDWIVAPGADYRQIQLRAQGPDGVELTSPDQIVLALRESDVRMEIPEAYQIDGAEKVPVRATLEMPEPNLLAYHVEGERRSEPAAGHRSRPRLGDVLRRRPRRLRPVPVRDHDRARAPPHGRTSTSASTPPG